MQIQRALGSDIIMAFDHCPPGKSELDEVTKAVKRTNEWFIRCKNYLKDNPRLYKHKTLFPIIQGINHKMREMSIEGLVPQADFGIQLGALQLERRKTLCLIL